MYFQDMSADVAAKVKGMLRRGDRLQDIAVWFGVNLHKVRAVQTGAVHPFVPPAPHDALPPPGPYAHASRVYSALSEVQAAEYKLFHLRYERQGA